MTFQNFSGNANSAASSARSVSADRLDFVVFFHHLIGCLDIPVVFFKNFTHELIQITNLTFIFILIKISNRSISVRKYNIVIIIAAMT